MSTSLINSYMVEKHGNRPNGLAVVNDEGDDTMVGYDKENDGLEAVPKHRGFTEADRARIASEAPKSYSRDEHRKLKALEEARKMGTAPAEVDEEGYEINPHIPHYVKRVPWYFDKSGQASLKHQRNDLIRWKDRSMDTWYKRGQDAIKPKQVKKWKAGSCENCGASTHKKSDCLERPRKVGAKYSNKNIAADDVQQPVLDLGFEGKRDAWNGYDPDMHAVVYEKYRKIELAKKALKLEKLEKRLVDGEKLTKEEIEAELQKEDEDKYTDEDLTMTIVPKEGKPQNISDPSARHIVRNLRIREDTAKYLRNLDVNSAYYDPKTRSMRDNPNPDKETDYKGDNFIRSTGEAHEMVNAQTFVWDANKKGVEMHLFADPTRVAIMKKEVEQKKKNIIVEHKSKVLDRYGGEEHFAAPDKELLFGQTGAYKEYTRAGRLKESHQMMGDGPSISVKKNMLKFSTENFDFSY